MAGTFNDIYLYNFNGITIPWPKLKRPRIDWDFQFKSSSVINETIKFYYPKKWDNWGDDVDIKHIYRPEVDSLSEGVQDVISGYYYSKPIASGLRSHAEGIGSSSSRLVTLDCTIRGGINEENVITICSGEEPLECPITSLLGARIELDSSVDIDYSADTVPVCPEGETQEDFTEKLANATYTVTSAQYRDPEDDEEEEYESLCYSFDNVTVSCTIDGETYTGIKLGYLVGDNELEGSSITLSVCGEGNASGVATHAEGRNTRAIGDYSHSEGWNTKALGIASHAGGIGTMADEDGMLTIGTYNELSNNSNLLFAIGNGTGNSNRSNALSVNDKGLITVDNRGGLKLTSGGSTDKVWNTNGTITDLSGLTPGGTDEKVKQTDNSDTGYKPILTATSTSPTSGNAAEAQYDTTVGIQHSTGYIQANSVRIDDDVYATFQHNTSTNYHKFEAVALGAYLELIDDNSSANTITVNLAADDAYIKLTDKETQGIQKAEIYAEDAYVEVSDNANNTLNVRLDADDAYIKVQDTNKADISLDAQHDKQEVDLVADDAYIEIIDENGNGGRYEKINIHCDDTSIILNDTDGSINMETNNGTTLSMSSASLTMSTGYTDLTIDESASRVSISGDVYASGAYYASSDARKKDIVSSIPLDKAYELVEKCQTIFYTWKNDEDKNREVGLLAQEVQQYFPELVSEGKDGYLTLEYSRLVVILMAVIKDLTKKVNTLSSIEERLKALENKVG